jgi:hypothetical protein
VGSNPAIPTIFGSVVATSVMRSLQRFIALLVALMVLSLFGNTGTGAVRVITGDVVEWHAGQSISVVNDSTDPWGVRFDLRGVDYDGDRGALKRGARVSVSYRYVGERYPVALQVQVLDPQTP